jgi:hypothetical protein
MFSLDAVVVCSCVSSTYVFFYRSSWSCIGVVCAVLACRHMIVFSPCLCSLYFGEVLCLVRGGCETVVRNDECMVCPCYLLW